jgi:hypothetical protein
LDRFFLRTEDGVTTMRRWSDGRLLTGGELGRLISSASGVQFLPDGKRFLTISSGSVYTLRDLNTAQPIAILGRPTNASINEDRALIIRNRNQRILLKVESVAELRGAALRDRVCDLNRDWIGSFTKEQRDVKSEDATARDIARRLRGRPWHVCDWRGLRSLEGWGQMFRYWGVRFGLAKDWAPDERPGQPRPRAQKKAADAPRKKD